MSFRGGWYTFHSHVWYIFAFPSTYDELFKGQEEKTKTQGELGKAIEILWECGADGWVEKYEKELSALL
jgi:hypothetical protein